jgi:hypothetical protein
MRRISTFLLFFLLSFRAMAQDADSIAGKYMNSSDWFQLNELYASQSKEMSPFMRLFSKAMLANFFNRPAETCADIDSLLKNHQAEMGFGNICSMMYLLPRNIAEMGNFKGAADVLKSFISQIDGKVDAKTVEPYRDIMGYYDLLSQYKLFQSDSLRDVFTAQFRLEKIGSNDTVDARKISIDGTINGIEQNFTFDTGAAMNVVTPEVARQCNMRMLNKDIKANGIKQGVGQLAIADSIKIGDLVMRNVTFTVLDMMANNEIAADYLVALKAIIGVQVMKKFAETELDFTQNKLYFRRNATPKSMPSNFYIDNNSIIGGVINGNERLKMNIDCGANSTQMYPNYYKNHNAEVLKKGKWKIGGSAGYGGMIYNSIFRMPHIMLSLGGSTLVLDNIDVIAMSTTDNNFNNLDGVLGVDAFMKYKKMIFDFRHCVVQTF